MSEEPITEKQSKSPSSEPSNFYTQIVDHAKSEITWVRSAYKFAASLVAIVVVVGIYFTYRSSYDFKAEMRQEIDRQKQQMLDHLTAVEAQMQENFDKKVATLRSEVEARIEEEFQKENIHGLVEDKAKSRVDEIADPLIRDHITKLISPQIESAQGQIETVKTEMAKADKTLSELKSISEFTTTVIAAQNDDRSAFDRLKKWSQNSVFPLKVEAEQAWVKILDSHASPILWSGDTTVPWKEGIDPLKFSIDNLKANFSSAPPLIRIRLLGYIWGRDDFPKYQRMAFLAHVLETDNNLSVVESAARLFMRESKQKLKPLAVDQQLEWWEENRKKIESNQ
jgi:hypothetical protein